MSFQKPSGQISQYERNEGIPRQYSNAARASNKAGKEETESAGNEGDKTPTEDPDEMSEFDLWTKLMHTVKDMTVEELYNQMGDRVARVAVTEIEEDVDVCAHTEFYDVIARLVKGSNINVSTSDNGADICVVGTG